MADIFHMATESALACGRLTDALAAAQQSRDDTSVKGLAHFAATHLVVPLVLRGEFDQALVQAQVMRDGWERSGRPAAGWMAPSFFATALAHGLMGNEPARAEWWELGDVLSFRSSRNSCGLYAGLRLALHGRPAEGVETPSIRTLEEAPGQYLPYAVAALVELAVVGEESDAEQQLGAASKYAVENDFAAAALQRAAGRLHHDLGELAVAVAMFEAIGARFERACTLMLLPDRADEGLAELAALGCLPSSGQ
ncbi:MAG TPA: hypothetical protein VGM93_02245 [Acidimicrobiales bacterium]